MHEWALAESILIAVVEKAGKEHLKKITEIHISLGELQQIEQDIFEFALDEIIKSKNSTLKDVRIIIEIEEASFQCKNCEHSWKFSGVKQHLNGTESEAIHFIPEVVFVHMRCPQCNSPDFEILKGRGVSITSIKGVR